MTRFSAFALRLLLCALLTSAVIGIAYAALFVTTAPAPVSLLAEPFSLLLTPGLLIALAIAGHHDFSPSTVLLASAIFYFVLFFAVLSRRTHTRSR